jgi:autotransporter-associated beta strand protein
VGTYAGVIAGAGNFTLGSLSTQILTLSGANTYTGNTIVAAGTLVLADNAQLKFVLGSTSGTNNTLTGAGTAILDGDFVIDTSAADALVSGTWTLEDVTSLTGAYGASFSVVDFVDAGDDKWTKTVGSKKYTFDETTGILTLTSAASYASWIDGFFPGETNPAIIGAAADPDNDGIANGVEMVIGGNPATSMDTALLPTIELVTDPVSTPAIPAGNYLLFTYRRSDLSVAGGVTSDCETDTDLVAPWTAATGAPGVVIQVDDNFTFTPPAAANTDRVRVYVPRGVNTVLFGRLNVKVP